MNNIELAKSMLAGGDSPVLIVRHLIKHRGVYGAAAIDIVVEAKNDQEEN